MLESLDKLQEELEEAFKRSELLSRGVTVLALKDDSIGSASLSIEVEGFDDNEPIPIGCIAKCFTATLIEKACSEFSFDLGTKIRDIPGLNSRVWDQVDELTLAHLLNHTHGLDGSHIGVLRRTAQGYIDAEYLCQKLRDTDPIAEPGSIYCYGGAGTWLAGALLEELYSRLYSELLFDFLKHDLALDIGSLIDPICPSSGGNLQMSARTLLQLLRYHLTSLQNKTGSILYNLMGHRVSMPGWSLGQQSATAGWNHYGDSWFGHNGNPHYKGTLLGIAIRFNPEIHAAVVVTSTREQDCFYVLGRLFKDDLTEYWPGYNPIPTKLSKEAWISVAPQDYVGVYQNAVSRLEVTFAGQQNLRLEIFDKAANELRGKKVLIPAKDHFFFTIPSGADFPYVQFVRNNDYIWNCREVWRRVG